MYSYLVLQYFCSEIQWSWQHFTNVAFKQRGLKPIEILFISVGDTLRRDQVGRWWWWWWRLSPDVQIWVPVSPNELGLALVSQIWVPLSSNEPNLSPDDPLWAPLSQTRVLMLRWPSMSQIWVMVSSRVHSPPFISGSPPFSPRVPPF